jgi:hypothetical protein
MAASGLSNHEAMTDTASGPPHGDPLVTLYRGEAAIPRRYEVARYGLQECMDDLGKTAVLAVSVAD